ncbi:hypothetical protein MCERE10_02395 [Burkholderiaceae bacterium]
MTVKLEAVIATLATRDDVARFEVTFRREMSAQAWKVLTTLIVTLTALVVVTYCLVNNIV